MPIEELSLVPYPMELRQDPGFFRLRKDTPAQVRADLSASSAHYKLQSMGFKAQRGDVEPMTVKIGEPNDGRLRPPRNPEGYVMRCDADGIVVRGSDADGLFWGLTTLEQLIDHKNRVPFVEIRDWPAFSFRGHHDDISRKQISTLDDFLRIIRLLSKFKIRYYTPYIEDVLFLPSFPMIGKGRGRLRPKEVQTMMEEAKRNNVTIFPTFSLIGHQENLLRDPDMMRRFGREVFQAPSSFDPNKTELRPFLSQVIREVCEIFADSPFFHAGFDETQGVTKEEFISHANWCAEEIRKHGKRMLMWTDMLRNHFGIDCIHELSDNIVPVEWNYNDPTSCESGYSDLNVSPMGLAGYLNWCRFLPDSRPAKRNIEQWAETMHKLEGPGFAASQWGDDGYENHRDQMWNLFAYNGEVSWRGSAGPENFEERFQSVFYGRALPALSRVIEEYPEQRPLSGNTLWKLFRENMHALARRAAVSPDLARNARQTLALVQKAEHSLKSARNAARERKEHIDHFAVALARERNVCERIELALRYEKGMQKKKLDEAVMKALAELEKVRTLYRDDWLHYNRRPNIEISLRVYDDIARSLRALLVDEVQVEACFEPLDLDVRWNRFNENVAGVPFGLSLVGRTPFHFAPSSKTHCGVEQGESLIVNFEPKRLKDIHIVYGANGFKSGDHSETVLILAERDGKTVFREALKNVEQICDWWAPLGEHIWAGGGYRYVDQKRNALALTPGKHYGLMHLRGFKLPPDVEVDSIEIRCMGKGELAVFAVTLEKAD